MTDDGSHWVDMVTGVLNADRALTPIVQARIKNALLAEIIAKSQRPEMKDIVTISFPEMRDGKPSVRIHIAYPESEENKRFMDYFIAEKTENFGVADAFLVLKKAGKVQISLNYLNGYHGRCDTTITAESTQDLLDAVASMITNPLIKQAVRKSGPSEGIAG